MHFDEEQIENLNKIYRINLINSCSGYKAANLIGTVSDKGDKNLAIFSSIVHLGSNPPLLGFFLRPTEIVPRHTYLNIKENSYYTINSVQKKFADKAHHTSAKYDRNISEFNVTEIEPENINNFPAPFVKASSIKIGMKFVEEIKINYNKSRLIVGKIVQLNVDENLLTEDGFINLNDAKIATISGCDGYSFPDKNIRKGYQKPKNI
jgi:flavin reductase (DIM6/NTAB) family NADH-FMN oxidoreductase RutF